MAERVSIVPLAEAHAVGVGAVRRCRPTVTADTDLFEATTMVMEITGSRIPDGRSRTELTREVHASFSAVVK